LPIVGRLGTFRDDHSYACTLPAIFSRELAVRAICVGARTCHPCHNHAVLNLDSTEL